RGDGRTNTRRRVPAFNGIKSDNSYRVAGRVELERRVGAAGDIVERRRMRRVRVIDVFADLVDGLTEESQPSSGSLIGNRSDSCALRGTGAGATEGEEASRVAGNVEIRQYAMENGSVIGDVRHGPLLAAVQPTSALLVGLLVEQNAESSAGRN